jgi:purine-binding chemotaxis protein CheW
MDADAATSISQYLTFKLDQELFAVDICKVREVLELSTMTKVPRTPDFMRGVINLRGSVVPVVDVRLKLGLGMTDRTVDTCVVIAEIAVDGERTVLGALVDSVQEVIDLDANHLAPPPHLGSRVDASVIRGMGKRDDQFIMILDLDRVFTVQEVRDSPTGADADAAAEPASVAAART